MENLEQKIKNLLSKRDKIDAALKKDYGNIFGGADVVADFGEYLAADRLGLNLMGVANHKGYDGIGKQDGKKYQVKTRKASDYGLQTLFPINESGLNACDYLVCVGLNSNWSIAFMAKIPSNEVKPNKHNRFYLNKEFLDKYGVKTTARYPSPPAPTA